MLHNLDKTFKVLIAGPIPPPTGGDSIWLKSFANCLASIGINHIIVNTSVIGSRFSNNKSGRNLIYEIIRCFKIWLSLVFGIMMYKPSIIHYNSNCAPLGLVRDFLSLFIIRLFSIPLIMHCHANIPISINKSSIGRYFLVKCIKKSSCVFVLNKRSLRYTNVFTNNKCYIVSNFIDSNYVAKSKIINKKIENAIFVGHVIESKGIFELLQVAKIFTNVNFACAGLVLIDLKNICVSKNVIFLGDVSRDYLTDLYAKADIFIFPTYNEGFSMALLEAMAMGLPVVTTRVGANYEMVGIEGGVLIKVKSTQDIIQAILYLNDQELREQISFNNINKVKSNYTNEIIIPTILQYYKLLICDND